MARYLDGFSLTISLWAPIVALGVLVLKFTLDKYTQRRKIAKYGCFAQKVATKFPFGLDLAIKMLVKIRSHELFEWTAQLLDVPGRTIEFHMANTRLIMTDNPENIKAIMSTQFTHFGHGSQLHEAYKTTLGDSIFATDGEAWVNNKNQLRPHISKLRPTDAETIEKHIRVLFSQIPSDASSVEINDLLDRYQLDVVTEIFLGESANALAGKSLPFRNAIDRLLRLNTFRLAIGRAGLLVPDSVLAPKSIKDLNEYLDSYVNKARSLLPSDFAVKAEKDYTLMESMVSKDIDSKAIKDQLVAVLLGAKDPSCILLTSALYELSHRPEIVEKLRSEISSIIGSSVPTQDHIKQMPYLKNIMQETIRLYHPLGMNFREAQVDTSLPFGGGPNGDQPVGILAGTQIAISTMGLQRRQDLVGPDADIFRPERWETWTPGMWEYIPFNHGPRICIGRNFGQFQLAYTLIRVFQEFTAVEIGDLDAPEQRIKIEMNTKLAYPVFCRFIR